MLTPNGVRTHLDSLAKPRGSLGRLEALAVRLATLQNTLRPIVRPRRLVIFAADHGVVASGVSAWPSSVTGLMVETILARRATCSALARSHDCDLRLIDVGVASPPVREPPDFYRNARIAPGSHNLAVGPAMSEEQFERAWRIGAEEAERAIREGYAVLIAGELGIGNTTPAACLTMLLAHASAQCAVGRGAGVDDETLAHKSRIVAQAVANVQPLLATQPRRALAAISGFELIAMGGFFAAGAAGGATLLLDGFVATAAALVARQLCPPVTDRLIATHLSAEPGHAHALACLGLQPLLDWNMRLGEGTGALIALPLLDSAATLLCDVAALAELGVSRGD